MRRNGNVTDTDDDEHRIMRDGETVYVGMQFMDHQPQPKEIEMTFSPHLTTIDGATTTKDSAIRVLQDQLKSERSRADRLEGELSAIKALHAPAAAQPVQDATATLRDAAEASRRQLRDHLLAQQASKFSASTPEGARSQQLRDAWKQRPTA